MRRHIVVRLLFALLAPAAAFAADDVHLKREVPVPGGSSGWDYVVFDPATSRLFVGHRNEGLQVFDTAHDFHMAAVEDTKGSNGATLLPEFKLGVSHNNDGTLTVFRLDDLKTERRIKVGDDLDSSRYDPVTKRLITLGVPGADGKGSDVGVYSVPGFERVGTISVPAENLENSAADGSGGIFVAVQDRDSIVRFDMHTMKVAEEWPTTGCKQPTGLAYDSANKRLMIGCRGAITEPMFVVMNTDTGAVVFKTPIGAGNDGVAYDAARHRVFLTNGVGANMTIFDQIDADHYNMAEVVGTRPNARTNALDPNTGDVFTVTAEGIYDPSKKNLTRIAPFYPNVFSKDSFRILQYEG
jgi:hypothetical protein